MTQGSPAKLILRFSLPLLLGNLFQQLYSVVDSVVIGQFVGSEQLGGIGCTGSADNLIFSLGYGISGGIGILTATMFGAGEQEKLTKAIYNCAYVLLGVSLLITLLGYFGSPLLLTLLRTPETLYPHAKLYMQVVSLGSIGSMFYGAISAVMRSLGDSKTPLLILILSCIVNVVLDLLFVLAFHWDVFGVAAATVISQIASAAISYVAAVRLLPVMRYQKGALKPEKALLLRCIRYGVPLAGQNALIALSCMVLQFVINGFGDVIVTANTAVSRIEQFVQQPFNSLSTALCAYTGQNMGARRTDRVKAGMKVGLYYVLIVSVVMLAVMQLFGGYILQAFGLEEEIIAVGVVGLRITSCFYLCLGTIYVARGVLNGAGDSLYAAMNGVIELVCRFSLAFLLIGIPGIGMWGCFLCSCATWTITGAISMLRYFRGRWRTIDTKKTEGL